MKITLLNHTPEALDLLLFTKQTRLALEPGLMDEIRSWPEERKMKELDYMRGTIQSSWEFVDYVFLIEGVSRAFTHQLVRSRGNSYAQQSQRTVDMSGFEYIVPRELRQDPERVVERTWGHNRIPAGIYHTTMDDLERAYHSLVESGVPPQDARGVLPTNIATNIVVKANLRSMADMAKLRLCTRTQGEYQDVFREMRERVLEVHSWAEPFIRVHCAATGVCAFPNYHECPIKGPLFNPDTGRRWDEAKEVAGVWGSPDGSGGLVSDGSELVWIPLQPHTREEQQKAWEEMEPFEARPQQVVQ
jgi:flavin-dependent thymidylate synthase